MCACDKAKKLRKKEEQLHHKAEKAFDSVEKYHEADEKVHARLKKVQSKYSKKADDKIATVMREFKEGELPIGKSKKKVKSRKQAIAIGIAEAKKAGYKVPTKKKRK